MDPARGRLATVITFAVALFIFAGSGRQAAANPEQSAQGNSCVACHEDTWQDEVSKSIHGRQQITCDRCHGGDPTQFDKDKAKAPETGYIGIPDKKQIVERCAACHADVEAMNAFGTRTDQLARYRTSAHGKRLLGEGDERAAACVDCHGYHDIISVSDPNSPVYPANIPKTCESCHSKEKLMTSFGHPSDIGRKYENSVHGKALLEKKDLGAAHCVSCHGSHGAVPPGVKNVSDTCGKCHANEKKYFLESPHASANQQGKFSECISCHGNHDVAPPTPALYAKACAQCHEPDSAPMDLARKLPAILDDAKASLEQAEGEVRRASIEGIFVEPEAALLQEARSAFVEMAPVQHTLSPEKIGQLNAQLSEKVRAIRTGIEEKRRALRSRKLFLIPIWIFIFVMAAALLAKYRQLKNDQHFRSGGHP